MLHTLQINKSIITRLTILTSIMLMLIGGYAWSTNPVERSTKSEGASEEHSTNRIESLIDSYVQMSEDFGQGGVIVANVLQTNYYTGEDLPGLSKDVKIGDVLSKQVVSVTEYIDHTRYRRELCKYQGEVPHNFELKELNIDELDEKPWKLSIDIFNETQHALFVKDNLESELYCSQINSREEEIKNNIVAKKSYIDQLIESKRLVVVDVAPSFILFEYGGGVFKRVEDLLEKVRRKEYEARIEKKNGTITLSFKNNNLENVYYKWIIDQSSYPYPAAFETWWNHQLYKSKRFVYKEPGVPTQCTYTQFTSTPRSNRTEDKSLPWVQYSIRFVDFETNQDLPQDLFQMP